MTSYIYHFRRILLSIFSLFMLITYPVFSQSPQKISYQAVLRDADKTITIELVLKDVDCARLSVVCFIAITTNGPLSNHLLFTS